MKISDQIAKSLYRIKLALQRDDLDAISQELEQVHLPELLSSATIDEVRARREHVVCVFLCSLAVTNDVAAERAASWLACYQSILTKTLDDTLARLPSRHVRATTVLAIASKLPLTKAVLKSAKGNDQDWQDSIELCLDFNDWPSAVSLIEARSQMRATGFWRQIAESLAFRQKVYLGANIYQDDVRFARLYEVCIRQGRAMGDIKLASILTPLKINSLERGGRFTEAIDILRSKTGTTMSVGSHYTLARLHCKSGDLKRSAMQLDLLLGDLLENGADHSEMNPVGSDGICRASGERESSFLSRASHALIDLSNLLRHAQQKIFLVSGTLLGYVREGRLLAHDKDIDVGVIGWEEQFALFKLLWESPLFLVSPKRLKGSATHLLPINHRSTGVAIDIFLYRKLEDKLITGVEFNFGHRQRFEFTPFELSPIKFLDVDLYVPSDSERNLMENFGNWRIPDKGYLSHLESPSVMEPGGLDFMITARLQAIDAVRSNNMNKLRRVLDIATRHGAVAGALDTALVARLAQHCRTRELYDTAQSQDSLDAMVEVAHA
jgi:hypothetical protein